LALNGHVEMVCFIVRFWGEADIGRCSLWQCVHCAATDDALAQSGLSETSAYLSAFGGKADIVRNSLRVSRVTRERVRLTAPSRAVGREERMRYKPKGTAALHVALGGLPDKMRVEADKNLGVSAKTVGELRRVTAWSENLVITTPEEVRAESAVKVSRTSV